MEIAKSKREHDALLVRMPHPAARCDVRLHTLYRRREKLRLVHQQSPDCRQESGAG